MHGVGVPHAQPEDEQESITIDGNTVVYDPEFPAWYLTT